MVIIKRKIKDRQESIINILKKYKQISFLSSFNWIFSIDIYDENKLVGFLYPINIENNNLIILLAKWRSENIHAFLNQNKISINGTNNWLKNIIYPNENKILFIIYDLDLKPIGHIGLAEFNYEKMSCEIDNVVRGVNKYPGIMTFALNSIINWAKETLKIKEIRLRVLLKNKHAIDFYKRNNFIYDGENEDFIKMKLKE